MTPLRRRTLLAVAGWTVGLAILLATAVALRDRWETVAAAGGVPSVAPITLAVLANAGATVALAWAWRDIVAAAGWRLDLRLAAWIWGASQLARYTLGAAQIGGRALLARRHGVPVAAGAATSLVDTLWQTSLNAAVVLATVPWWLPGGGGLEWVAWSSALPVAVLVSGLVRPDALVAAVRRLLRTRVMQALTRGRFAGGRQVHLDRRTALSITGLFVVNTAARIGGFLVLYHAVGGDVRAEGLLAVGAYVLGKLVGQAAVFVPAGIGPREGATALVVAGVIGGGAAFTLVAVTRLAEILAEVVFVAGTRLAVGGGAEGGTS